MTPFAESCTFLPLCSAPFLPASPTTVTKTVFPVVLHYLCQHRGLWIYQAKLGSTDSDRGNVDRVTSHAFACPFSQALYPRPPTGWEFKRANLTLLAVICLPSLPEEKDRTRPRIKTETTEALFHSLLSSCCTCHNSATDTQTHTKTKLSALTSSSVVVRSRSKHSGDLVVFTSEILSALWRSIFRNYYTWRTSPWGKLSK